MSGAYRTYFDSGAYRKYLNERKVTPTKYMVQLSATMEQTHETQQVQLYDVLGLRLVNARYDDVSPLHETGPWDVDMWSQTDRELQVVMTLGEMHIDMAT